MRSSPWDPPGGEATGRNDGASRRVAFEVFTGHVDGDILTVARGGPLHARLIRDFGQPDVLRSSMHMSQDGVGWRTFMDAEYRRG